MKIDEFQIRDYGPLPERGRYVLENFNVFYGENESGKTLTIDALIKILVGKSGSNFKQIDRIDEVPEGHITILEDNGRRIKIKGKNRITDLIDLTFGEFCNLFIIRNSDLSISKEKDFYNNITDKLLGLRINDINAIESNLRDLGKLTPTGKYTNRGEEKFEERMNKAKKYVQVIESLSKKIEEEKFDLLEETMVNLKTKREEIRKRLKNQDNARKREIFEKGISPLEILKEKKEEIKSLEIYNEKDKDNWKEYENNLNIFNQEKSKLMSELKENIGSLNNITEEIKQKQIDLKIPTEINTRITTEIKREIFEYEVKTGDLGIKREKTKFFNMLLIITSILFGMSLFVALISSSILGYFLASIFGGISILFIAYRFQFIKDKGWVDGLIERLNLELIELGLKGGNFEEITSNIQNFEINYKRKESELNNLMNSKNNLESLINQLNNSRIPEIDIKIKTNEDSIRSLKKKSRTGTIDEYLEQLNLNKEYRQTYETQKAILKNLFGSESVTDEEQILFWSNELKQLEVYKDKSIELRFDEEIVNSLRDEIIELENQIESLTVIMSEINNELSDIEIEVNNILNPKDDHYHCSTSNDLIKIQEKLLNFQKENNEVRDNILEIIEIFKDIETKEREKISKLLSKKSMVAEYFKEITDGLYHEIRFDIDSAQVEVKRKDDQFIKIEHLSGGTYDQLYFTIRLALAEKILKDQPGFFILDDPFIKADSERLRRQIQMLKKICEFGWQVLYFTSKDEIVDSLKEDIDSGNVNYFKLENLIS